MERIVGYSEIPKSDGRHSIYIKFNSDAEFLRTLFDKGYRLINHINDADEDTIYVSERQQDYMVSSTEEYHALVDEVVKRFLKDEDITTPKTYNFDFDALLHHKYKLPFVFKNVLINRGKEKFLIQTEEDYEKLINACSILMNPGFLFMVGKGNNDDRYHINYRRYLSNFVIQEYVDTPTDYNTSVRLLTSSSNDLLYASLKYNEVGEYTDETSLVGSFLSTVYPISTKSIVSNTCSGGSNIILGEDSYTPEEKKILSLHDINSDQFRKVVSASQDLHELLHSELGILCGFDYIYDKEKQKWFLLEYHSVPMVGDYVKRFGFSYDNPLRKKYAEGHVRATALCKKLEKTR